MNVTSGPVGGTGTGPHASLHPVVCTVPQVGVTSSVGGQTNHANTQPTIAGNRSSVTTAVGPPSGGGNSSVNASPGGATSAGDAATVVGNGTTPPGQHSTNTAPQHTNRETHSTPSVPVQPPPSGQHLLHHPHQQPSLHQNNAQPVEFNHAINYVNKIKVSIAVQ